MKISTKIIISIVVLIVVLCIVKRDYIKSKLEGFISPNTINIKINNNELFYNFIKEKGHITDEYFNTKIIEYNSIKEKLKAGNMFLKLQLYISPTNYYNYIFKNPPTIENDILKFKLNEYSSSFIEDSIQQSPNPITSINPIGSSNEQKLKSNQ